MTAASGLFASGMKIFVLTGADRIDDKVRGPARETLPAWVRAC